MRAVLMKPGKLSVIELPQPTPGPGQVLVKVLSCGICGSDLHLYRHAQDMIELGVAAGADRGELEKGMVLGHEFVGEIFEFGPDTKQKLSLGDRVCSVPFLNQGELVHPIGATQAVSGAYAQYLLLTEAVLLRVPDTVPLDAAALTEPLAIGIHAVERCAADPGGRPAVVLGCGPIGLTTIAVLKDRGARDIIAADFSPRRRELAIELGATQAVDPALGSAFAGLTETHPGLPAMVFECTGANGVLGKIVLEAPARSEVIVAGICHGEDAFMPMMAISKELSLHFVSFYTTEEFATALDMLARKRINWQPLITGKVGLSGVAGAFAALGDPQAHAKVLIDPWSDAQLA